MSRANGLAAALAAVGLLLVPLPGAAMDDYIAPRARGMAGALRGEATGDAALQLNPSGMSLARFYALEGGYQLMTPDSSHMLHASVVDSSTSIVAGGAFYNYRFGDTDHSPTGHEAGLMFSVPFAERAAVGGGFRYLWLDGPNVEKGFTFDAGLSVKIIQSLSVGVAGRNLRERGALFSPTVGYGVAFHPIPALLLALDGEQLFESVGDSTSTRSGIHGGGELVFQQRFAFRLGGGRDARRQRGIIAAGLSLLSEAAALDLAFQQDLSGSDKLTFVAASVRLFLPNTDTSAPPPPTRYF